MINHQTILETARLKYLKQAKCRSKPIGDATATPISEDFSWELDNRYKNSIKISLVRNSFIAKTINPGATLKGKSTYNIKKEINALWFGTLMMI